MIMVVALACDGDTPGGSWGPGLVWDVSSCSRGCHGREEPQASGSEVLGKCGCWMSYSQGNQPLRVDCLLGLQMRSCRPTRSTWSPPPCTPTLVPILQVCLRASPPPFARQEVHPNCALPSSTSRNPTRSEGSTAPTLPELDSRQEIVCHPLLTCMPAHVCVYMCAHTHTYTCSVGTEISQPQLFPTVRATV